MEYILLRVIQNSWKSTRSRRRKEHHGNNNSTYKIIVESKSPKASWCNISTWRIKKINHYHFMSYLLSSQGTT